MYFDVLTLDDYDKKELCGLTEAHIMFLQGEDPYVEDFDEEDEMTEEKLNQIREEV